MRPRLVNGLPVAPACGHAWDRIENLGGGLTRCRDCDHEGVDPATPYTQDDIKSRLLLLRATRFSFEAKVEPGCFPYEIDAEFVPQRYGGGWRVKRGNKVLCRKKDDPMRFEWGYAPYSYSIEEVKIPERDQAVSMALDIAEARIVVAGP